MSFIIGKKCEGVCDTACVDVCPVDCIHGPIKSDNRGQEVQNIVLDNPEAPFSNKLSLGLVTMMIGACILDQFHVSTFNLRATQVIVGTLMIIFQGMSLFRCSRSIESKRI